jgi:hypothetical protein
MKVWYWCPCCQRAFLGEAPEPARSPLSGLLVSLSVCEPSPVDCAYADCGATARVVMTWSALRRWAAKERGESLPPVPAAGQRYPIPGAGALDRVRV